MANVSFEQLMQNYVNAPYSVLLNVAREAVNTAMPVFAKVSKDGNGASILLPFLCVVVAVDGKFSELEYKFIQDVTGIDETYDGFKNFIQQFYTDEWVETIDNMVDACPDEIKNTLLSFALSLAAVDETITRVETAFIAKLIA